MKAQVALLIATHIVNEYCKPGSDAKAALDQITRLDAYKLIVSSHGWQKRGLDDLMRELRETAAASTAKAGTAQAAVDHLVDISSESRSYSSDEEPQAAEVLKFGLDAVEPLADEIDKHRLTRAFEPRFDNSPPKVVPVERIAQSLLLKIAKGELGNNGVTRKDALAWYEAKKSGKVETWLMSNLIEHIDGVTRDNLNVWQAIADVHPHLLRAALLKVRAMHFDDALSLDYVERSKLPEPEKKALLTEVCESASLSDAPLALWAVHAHNRAAYDKLLLKYLAKAPRQLDGDYAYLSGFAIGTENPKVWKTLDEVIARADTNMRICLLVGLEGVYEALKPDVYHKKALPILRKYFNDKGKITDYEKNAKTFSFFGFYSKDDLRTVGRVALRAAAYAAGIYQYNVPEMDEKGWAALRKKIESGDFRPLEKE